VLRSVPLGELLKVKVVLFEALGEAETLGDFEATEGVEFEEVVGVLVKFVVRL